LIISSLAAETVCTVALVDAIAADAASGAATVVADGVGVGVTIAVGSGVAVALGVAVGVSVTSGAAALMDVSAVLVSVLSIPTANAPDWKAENIMQKATKRTNIFFII